MEIENSMPDRILVADGQHLFRTALHDLARKAYPLAEIREADGFDGLMACRDFNPDLLLVDFYCPHYDAVTSAKWLRGEYPASYIVLVSTVPDQKVVDNVLDNGVDAYVSKFAEERALLAAMTATANDALNEVRIDEKDPRGGMTERQREVIDLLVQGKSNKEIARVLKISPFTVRIHVSAVLRYLDVDTRTAAAVKASGNGISQSHVLQRDSERGR